jgi:peptidoglycan/xylan/chitin deacetylase (PgdA/CDA1 family)
MATLCRSGVLGLYAVAHGGHVLYIGSVRFFKHLILILTGLFFAGLILAVIVLSINYYALQDENRRLEQELTLTQELKQQNSVQNFYKLYKFYQINAEEFLIYMLRDNPEALIAFYSSREFQQAKKSQPSVTETTPEDTHPSPSITTDASQQSNSEFAHLYPDLFHQNTTPEQYKDDTNVVYLTFDDGPSVYTDDILSILEKYNIKATFFVTTLNYDSELFKTRLQKIHAAGHTIGIHTHTHSYSDIYQSVESYLDDFYTAYQIVYDAIGEKPKLFRFPGGSINDYNTETREDIIAEMTRRGFIYFDWNVDSRDADDATWTEMYHTVLQQTATQNRAVILFHDRIGGLNTVYVLEDIIQAFLQDKRGYTFERLTPEVRPLQF